MSLRLASLLIVALGLSAAPVRGEAQPAKAPAKAAAKPAKPANKAAGPAKPAKDPDDEDDAPAKPGAAKPGETKPAGAKAGAAAGAKAGAAAKPSGGAAAGAKAGAAAKPATGAPAGSAAGTAGAGEGLEEEEDKGSRPVAPPEQARPSDMEGTSENPDAPIDYDAPRPTVVQVRKPRPEGYPIEEVWRPLTLPRFMTEVALDTRFNISPFINGQTLRARFGVTPEIQVGLLYNIGGIYEDGTRDTAFNTGKAVGVAGTYKVREWIAAQVVVPVYLEPFAASINLAAPMKFRFGERYALVIADEVVEIRLTKFVPSLTSEQLNEVNVSNENTNTRTDEGTFKFSGMGIFQYKPDVALFGRVAVSIVDFDSQRLGYMLKVGGQMTVIRSLDLSAQLGFDDLGDADNTFGLQLGAAFRI